MNEKDVVVIGGGTAGFLAAQPASMLGGKVMVVEKEKVGGICPNWGCIPMCFLAHCAETLRSLKEIKNYGIDVGSAKIDYPRLMGEKEKTVKGVVASMEARLQAINAQVVMGTAKITSPEQVEITRNDGTNETIRAKKIIIATGSLPRRYDIPGAQGAGVLTTRELLDIKEMPTSLTIIGRSVNALELATIWRQLGSAVTLIARKPQLLPNEDEELSASVMKMLVDEGVRMYAGVDIERIDDSKDGKSVTIVNNGTRQKVESQFVVFALGQSPLVAGLGLENVGIAISEGRIKTNERMETSVKGIYAVGDATGEMMLASVAMIQGMVAGKNAMGGNATIDYRVVPHSIRTLPPMAAVGMTESEAKEKGRTIKVARFPFAQNPKAGMIRESRGFVKMIADSASGELLGVHILGSAADELIHEAVIAMQMRGTVRDIMAAIHGHPCLHETIQRAAMSLSS